MRSRRNATIGSLLAAVLMGFFWVGSVLYKSAIDLDSSAFLGGSWIEPGLAVLEAYDREILGSYCAPHCGACLDSCPEGLPIHDVLRHRMYFEDYGDEKEAMRLYAGLERQASVCASCTGPCLGSCPVGIPIQERLTGAHELLSS